MLRRGVPVREIGGRWSPPSSTCCSPGTASAGPGYPGSWPASYDDPTEPGTRPGRNSSPASRRGGGEGRAGVRGQRREVRRPLDDHHGRRDEPLVPLRHDLPHVPRADHAHRLPGVNGGGWAHYVGQEKCRPVTGWATLAFALDWARPPRQMIQTAYWYLHTDQWRYDHTGRRGARDAAGYRPVRRKTAADVSPQSARMGWMPSHPTSTATPRPRRRDRRVGPEPGRVRRGAAEDRRAALRLRGPGRARELPAGADDLAGEPARVVVEGQRVLPRHLLGTDSSLRATEAAAGARPKDVVWHEQAPTGSSTCWSTWTSG